MLDPKIVTPEAAKTSFDDIYVAPDPREYYSVLGSLDYRIPDLAAPILRQTLSAWRARRERPATLLDLGCSYGVNAALLRYGLSVETLRARYTRRSMLGQPAEDVWGLDKRYFQAWPRVAQERIYGLDISQPAIDYALKVGLLDEGLAADFENGAPTRDQKALLADVDVVFSTGAVGYVGEKTFDAILSSAKRAPWVVSFVLRMFDYDAIARRLEKAGLVTEKLNSAAFLQRRFSDEAEARKVNDVLRARGIDSTGLEADGMFYAELFVSRPAEEVERLPLEEMVTVASGRNINLGPRYVHVRRGQGAQVVPAR